MIGLNILLFLTKKLISKIFSFFNLNLLFIIFKKNKKNESTFVFNILKNKKKFFLLKEKQIKIINLVLINY